MVSTLLENILVKTDSFIERIFRPPVDREPVEFGRFLNYPEKILLVAEADVAGACLASCLVPSLLQKFPSAEIGVVVNPEHVCLFDGQKNVTTYAWQHRTPHQLDSEFRRMSHELRKQDFHWAIDLAGGGRAEALMTYAGSAAVRTGVPGGDNDKYYNLIVKCDSSGGRLQQLAHLLGALKVELPGGPLTPPVSLSNTDRERAQRFLRQRKSSRGSGLFVGFAPEAVSGKRGMERLLQQICNRLASEYDPLQLLIAGNLIAADELKKNEQLRAHLFEFEDLRQMIAALAYCDRVVTGSAGLAWLLGLLGVRVALIVTGKDRLAELGVDIPNNVTVIRNSDEGGAVELAVRFTR